MPTPSPRPTQRKDARPTAQVAARLSTLVITNITKIAGLIVALNELMIRGQPRTPGLVVAGFMMAGGEGAERIVIALLEHVFSKAAGDK